MKHTTIITLAKKQISSKWKKRTTNSDLTNNCNNCKVHFWGEAFTLLLFPINILLKKYIYCCKFIALYKLLIWLYLYNGKEISKQ